MANSGQLVFDFKKTELNILCSKWCDKTKNIQPSQAFCDTLYKVAQKEADEFSNNSTQENIRGDPYTLSHHVP